MFSDTLLICDSLEAQNYSSPHNKLSRLKKEGHLYQIRRGRYEDNRNVNPHILACLIYGPSYLSFEYALSFYGLISERVSTYTSATTGKNRTKLFNNIYGNYSYQDIPRTAFPYDTLVKTENNQGYLIATPEKALCDTLCKQKPVTSIKALKELLFENLRLDKEEFLKLNFDSILFLCPLYKKKNLSFLQKLAEKTLDKNKLS